LADGFQRRRLKCEKLTDDRQQTTKQETGPCLLMDRDEMTSLYREPSIDASYQVLAEGFQRRRFKCKKLQTTDAK
jgi:hypothetical protein